MNDSQLGTLLRERNHWWRDPNRWLRDDPSLREVGRAPFDYRPSVLREVHPPGLYVLTGPRRVGKSVEIRRAISRLLDEGLDPRRIIYCSCDGFSEQDLRRLFVVGRRQTPTVEEARYWFIDEVTAVGAGWPAIVKDARDDTEVRHDCVVLTGSSALGLREATKNLAGRRGGVADSTRLLWPMSFRAFCQATGQAQGVPAVPALNPAALLGREPREHFTELSYWMEDLNAAWEQYIRIGGFPRAVWDSIETGDARPDYVADLWDVIRGEAITSAAMTDTAALGLLARLGENLASPLNATTVASDLDLGNYHRVNDRIDALTFSYHAWRCYQNDQGAPNPKAFRKVYFTDPVLARLPSLKNPQIAAPDTSRMSEQQLGVSLSRAIERDEVGSFIEAGGVMYERTATGKEIDFVGPALGVPFESKYVDRRWKQESKTLEARYGAGIMATRGVFDLEGPVWAVPTSLLAWLLD